MAGPGGNGASYTMELHFTAAHGVLGLVLTSAVLIAVPGPSILYLVGQALSAGRSSALRAVLGNALGTSLVALVVAWGIGGLLAHSGQALVAIRLVGATVLLAIGLGYLWPARARLASVAADAAPPGQASYRQSLAGGMIVGATNPKALIMFGTIVPSFITTAAANPALSLLALSLVPIGLGLLIDAAWVLAAHAVGASRFFTARCLLWVRGLGGALMVAMAVLLALQALQPGAAPLPGAASAAHTGAAASAAI